MTKSNFRPYLMLRFILNYFSILAGLEDQGDTNHSEELSDMLLLSLSKTSHFLCYPSDLIPDLVSVIFQIKCSKDCLLLPVE